MRLDMTKGTPHKLMLRFSGPMLAGNLLQQAYNIVDTVVVGRYVGKEALAAVGSSFAIMVLLNSIIIGLAMGASVLYSHLYGESNYKDLRRAICMATVFIILITLAISAASLILTDKIIQMYRMPPETVAYTGQYLRWIFGGLIFTALYNIASNTLRSLGDSRTPLYFLVAGAVINTVLDLLFVCVFGMEVRGAAIATVIGQAVSGVACSIAAVHKLSFLGFSNDDLLFDKHLFKTMAKYSVATGIQQSVMNFGIVMIQGLINTFGASLIAAFSAGVKIDAFAYMPVQDFGNAFATYTAQNTGAGEKQRVKQGLGAAAAITGAFSLAVTLLVMLFAEKLIGIFISTAETEVIQLGAQYLRIEGAFYILIGFLFMFYGFYRGIGKPNMSIVLTIISLGLRVLLAYTLAPHVGYTAIFWAIPLGWLVADIAGISIWAKKYRHNFS